MDRPSGDPQDESYLLFKAIFPMGAECLSCEEVFDMIAAYVEQHIEREALVARPVFEMISEHLGQCSGCMEVFKSLRDIYRLEKAGLLADMEDFLNTNTPLPLTDNPSEST